MRATAPAGLGVVTGGAAVATKRKGKGLVRPKSMKELNKRPYTSVGDRVPGGYKTALGGVRDSRELEALAPRTEFELLKSRSTFLTPTAQGGMHIGGVRFAPKDKRLNGPRVRYEKPAWTVGHPTLEDMRKVPSAVGDQALSEFKSPGGCNFGGTTRADADKLDPNIVFMPDVGPGTYSQPPAIGPQVLSNRRNPGGVPFTVAKRNELHGGMDSPGPAHMPPSQFGHKNVGFGFGAADRPPVWKKTDGPGPAFDVMKSYGALTNSKPSPKCSFGASKRKPPGWIPHSNITPPPWEYNPPHRSSYSPSFGFGVSERKTGVF